MKANRLINIIVMINVTQLFLISIFTYHIYLNTNGYIKVLDVLIIDSQNASGSMLVFLSIMTATTLFMISQIIRVNSIEIELNKQLAINKASQETILLLRCHRHDFLNHLQVIMGYLQMERVNEALDYIKSINSNLTEIRRVSGIKIPEIAVMLLLKKEEAMQHNIKLVLDINTDLSVERIDKVDIARILTNLIDNAIDELKHLDDRLSKIIKVTLDYYNEKLFIKVFNNHTFLEDTEKIFKPDYTTKGQGCGLGLFIINQIVKKYNGQVIVDSNKEGTTFNISI